jgi:hypothetical protein
MRARALAALLLVGLTLTAFAQTDYHPLKVGKQPGKAAAKPVSYAVWSAKPALTAQLGPEQALIGWAIRPPKGFVSTQKSDNGHQVYIFQGNPRPDNSSPAMWIVLGDSQRTDPNTHKQPAEIVLDFYMIQLHQNRDNWKSSAIEYGMIQGRKFVRRRWSATETTNGTTHHLRGIVYITTANAKFAALTLLDSDPGARSTLGLMETAAFTLHKR